MKKAIQFVLPLLLFTLIISLLCGCNEDEELHHKVDDVLEQYNDLEEKYGQLQNQLQDVQNQLSGIYDQVHEEEVIQNPDYSNEAYEKVKYIDKVLPDRDCYHGANFKLAQKWIEWNLLEAGYKASDIQYQDVPIIKYEKKTTDLKTKYSQANFSTDGKNYQKDGRDYVEQENGEYVKVTIETPNIIVTKKGKSTKQIIVGAHYDGTGTGDNGSGIALLLTTAQHFYSIETEYTLQFVFFTAEEYGCYGSTHYANEMTDEEVNNTLYMINMDSLVCGDYCYLYGGIQDNEKQVVTKTEAFDHAMKVATKLGLTFKQNPWTWENPAPGYDKPEYASPSTGDWSDHVGFKMRNIPYLYMEATNWEIPGPYKEYDGYGETVLVGMLMNTENDYLEYIETYFPGRIQHHLSQFSQLLNGLLIQTEF